jgi:hypothetical protein
MTLESVKERLHGYIEHADEKKLQAIYTLVEGEIDVTERTYDAETIAILEERRRKFIDSSAKGLSPEELIKYVREKAKKNGV